MVRMAPDDRRQFPADSITARDLRDFLGIRFQQEMTKDELREIYPYGKVAAVVNRGHQNGALSRESLRYICERCRTTKGTMFISKLGHCVCVDCSLVPAEPQANEGAD